MRFRIEFEKYGAWDGQCAKYSVLKDGEYWAAWAEIPVGAFIEKGDGYKYHEEHPKAREIAELIAKALEESYSWEKLHDPINEVTKCS
jgi:hypothetical protein